MEKLSVLIVFPKDRNKLCSNLYEEYILFVIKGQLPVMDYISNTIILYFTVHCIYVLCLFYMYYITCIR